MCALCNDKEMRGGGCIEWVRDVGSDIEMRGGGCRVGERCV